MNIVTIDFDIIMHRSLNLYNDLVDDDVTIQSILNANLESHFIPNPDLQLYNYLTQFVIKCAEKLPKENIIFIDDHDEITYYFTSGKIKYEEDFNIFNIDFHHDVSYDEKDIDNKIEEVDCGNWVKYIAERYPKFKQYIWIKAKEAEAFNKERFSETLSGILVSKKIIEQDIQKYNLDALLKSTDVLFLCKSIPWVPEEEIALYDTWKDIVDFLYKK